MRSGMTPRPETPGLSSLSVKRSWWPTQMQIVGRSARMRSRRTASSPPSLRRTIDEPNAPTPGSMTCEAVAISCGLSATRGSAPRRRKAACTEARLAVPVGAIRTSGMVVGRGGELDAVVDLVERQGNPGVTQLDDAVLVESLLERGRARPRVQGDERQLLGDHEVVLQARDQAIALPFPPDVIPLARRREYLDDQDRVGERGRALIQAATSNDDIGDCRQASSLDLWSIDDGATRRAFELVAKVPGDVGLDDAVRERGRRHHDRHPGDELPALRLEQVPPVERLDRPRQLARRLRLRHATAPPWCSAPRPSRPRPAHRAARAPGP